jgi:hypothetical protein
MQQRSHDYSVLSQTRRCQQLVFRLFQVLQQVVHAQFSIVGIEALRQFSQSVPRETFGRKGNLVHTLAIAQRRVPATCPSSTGARASSCLLSGMAITPL